MQHLRYSLKKQRRDFLSNEHSPYMLDMSFLLFRCSNRLQENCCFSWFGLQTGILYEKAGIIQELFSVSPSDLIISSS